MASWTSRLASNPLFPNDDGVEHDNQQFRSTRRPSGKNLEVPVPDYDPSTPPSSRSGSRRSHSRSISNPFPSLFGGKKHTSPRTRPQEPWLDAVGDEDMRQKTLSRSVSPHKRSPQPMQAEEHATRRCMMCDHTNSFPRSQKGFRCGKCTTINDLEPQHDPPLLQVPSQGLGMRLRNEGRVSLGRTQSIIDHCVTSFLRGQIDNPEQRDVPLAYNTRVRTPNDHYADRDDGKGNQDVSRSATPLPFYGTGAARSVNVSPAGSDTHPYGVNTGFTPSPHSRRPSGHYREPSFDRAVTPGATQADPRTTREEGARLGPNRSVAVFAPLEQYIVTHFDGCDSLNNSFLTLKSQHPRTASEGGQSLPGAAEEVISTVLHDAPVSPLDEKTLRLGDIAENGSWWTGERPIRHKSTDGRQRRIDSSSGMVSLKSPRINWSELSEWYRCILHAGESWVDKWTTLKPAESDGGEFATRIERYNSANLERLNQQIYDSRLHLRTALLKATERLLQRPKRPLHRPEDMRFIMIILENPLLYPSIGLSKDMATLTLTIPPSNRRSKSEDSAPIRDDSATSPTRASTSAAPMGERTDYRRSIVKKSMGLISNLPNECHHLLILWLSRFSESHFRRLVELTGSFVSYRLTRQRKRRPKAPTKPGNSNIDEFVPTFSSPGHTTPAQLHSALHREKSSKSTKIEDKIIPYDEDWQIKAAARVMSLLFRANFMHHRQSPDHLSTKPGTQAPHGHRAYVPFIPISAFYSTILDYSDLIADFEGWESRSSRFSFCQYSFFLSIWAKIRILEHDARRQMEAKAREAFFDSILGKRGVSQYFVLKVRRECLVEDSLQRVSEVVGAAEEEVKKGLRIEFKGEEGVDAGGLRKEWFLLLAREIFDPLHGLFLYDEDSQFCYFNPHCFESSEQFFLVGVLLGLAIYNSTILDIALPPFAFRKLLASYPSNSSLPTLSTPPQPFKCTLDDLAEYRPALAKGLRQLLEYDGDVEETFCQNFVVLQDRYGEVIEVPLCQGGEKRPVTNANSREFVNLYIRYVLNVSVSRQFEPFKRGFFTVCGGNALYLFRPEEIELLVRGSDEPLDIPSLRAVAVYENWPSARPDEEPVVNWFWDFFASLSSKNQRKMLGFITGTDRIPAMGPTNLVIRLVCLGHDSERFPSARTCFNMVALYRYRTRERLENKLWRAVCESEGFGLK